MKKQWPCKSNEYRLLKRHGGIFIRVFKEVGENDVL